MKTISSDEFLKVLRKEIKKVGSISEWARQNDFTRKFVSNVLHKKTPITDNIAGAIQYQRVPVDDEWKPIKTTK